MKRLIPWLLIGLLPLAWGADPLTLPELSTSRDRAVLQAEIARLEAVRPPDNDPERLKRLGIAWHNLSILEVRGASTEADNWLQQALKAAPTDYETMGYLGSAQTMVARDSWNVVTKVSHVNKGTALLDRAIRFAPENVTLRMVRINNSLALPGFFNRAPKAREDLIYLHGVLAKQTLLPETAAEICFRLGEIVKGEGDIEQARKLFAQASGYAPESPWGRQAQALLQRP